MNKEHGFYASMTKEVASETHKYNSCKIELLEEKVEREIGTISRNINGHRCDHQKKFKNGNYAQLMKH